MERKTGKKRFEKGKQSYDIQAIEDQIDDLMKNTYVPGIEHIDVNEAIKERFDTADFSELENLEKEIGLEDMLKLKGSGAAADIPDEYSLVDAEDEETAHLLEIEAENHSQKTVPKEMVDGSFELHVTEDKMSLLLDLHPSSGGGKALRADTVMAKIFAKKIVYGVNRELIERLVASVEQTKNEKIGVIVAQGKQPEEGKDGSIEYRFNESDEILRDGIEK